MEPHIDNHQKHLYCRWAYIYPRKDNFLKPTKENVLECIKSTNLLLSNLCAVYQIYKAANQHLFGHHQGKLSCDNHTLKLKEKAYELVTTKN